MTPARLTIEDLRDASRASGFRGVSNAQSAGGKDPLWCAKKGTFKKGTASQDWHGPCRRDPAVAAQDYCDYVNGQRKPLTIEDIRNPARASGFDHVGYKYHPSRPNRPKPYQAAVYGGKLDKAGREWIGPARATAEEAAQDYCDYINGKGVWVALPQRWPKPTIDMGNVTDHHVPSDATVRIKVPRFKGPHDLYDVWMLTHGGDIICRKVGITKAATRRYADISRTFGIAIKPYKKATTHPSYQAAKDAETALIARVALDTKNWERIGQEAFFPVTERTAP